MYLQITNRCNMKCKHCCYSCTANGQDMDIETVKAGLRLAADYGDAVTLGGGEPTLHPKFWEILGLTLGNSNDERIPYIITNGSQTEIAIALAGLAKRGVMGAALSQDPWHDPIDLEVRNAFIAGRKVRNYGENYTDFRDVRETQAEQVQPLGRARRWGTNKSARCICPGLFAKPNGDLCGCGCPDATPLGTVFAPEMPEGWSTCECSHCQEALKLSEASQ